jgi:hypothetical protein
VFPCREKLLHHLHNLDPFYECSLNMYISILEKEWRKIVLDEDPE